MPLFTRYARLLLRTGLDLQKGQMLLINADVEAAPLVRALTEEAYQMGAKEVQLNWSDEACDLARLLYQKEEDLTSIAPWEAERYNAPSRGGCAYLRLYSEDPQGFSGVPAARQALRRKAEDYCWENEARTMLATVARALGRQRQEAPAPPLPIATEASRTRITP